MLLALCALSGFAASSANGSRVHGIRALARARYRVPCGTVGLRTCRRAACDLAGTPPRWTLTDRRAVVTALLALIEPLGTADGAQETDTLIEEVVVTAAKREQGVYDVSASLSVFGGRDLSERGIADLVDIGRFVPNLNATTSPPGTRPRRIHSHPEHRWRLVAGVRTASR